MSIELLIDGREPADAAHALAASERGFHYGDGLFETALVLEGKVRFLDDHLERLERGCECLAISSPDRRTLLAEIARVTESASRAVLKIVITRGAGARGYRPGPGLKPTRLIALHPAPPAGRTAHEVAVRWCETRLARNAQLAGIKHLNRLEQVLAQAERHDERIAEGLMLDTEGELVAATAANVFLLRDGTLVTPDLRFCGIRGVMRARVLAAARGLGIATSEEPLWPHDLDRASEVLLTNAVRGIRSVVDLDGRAWSAGPVAERLRKALEV